MPTSVSTINTTTSTIQEELDESRNTFEMAFTHAAIGMSLVAPDGKWIKVNTALCNITGYTKHELIEKNYSELTYHEDLHKNQKFVEKIEKGEIDTFTLEKRYIHKDGHLIWVNITVSAIRDHKHKLLYMVTQVENITKRKQYEAKIKEQVMALQKFKKAVESTSDHIVITDPEGIILYANGAVRDITGYHKSEVIGSKAGKKWGGLMPKAFYESLWHTIKVEKKTFQGQVKNIRKDGTEYYAEIKISPIFDEDGSLQFFVGIERDVTREVEIDQMKTEFISLASHQLKTPLSAIRWFSEMLLDKRLGELNLRQRNCVDNITMSNLRMLDIVNDLLNISKIEAGKLSLDVKEFNLSTTLDDIIKELQVEINKKNQKVHINLHMDTQMIKTDRNALKNILSNLISNASKYTPENGEVFIDSLIKKNKLLVRVRDTGMGISDEAKSKIFSKFFRAENAINKNPEGTGLGLYTIKVLVNYLGGEIGFDSEVGKGSTFWFTLPFQTKEVKGEFTVE